MKPSETQATLNLMGYVAMEKEKLSDKMIDKQREIKETELEFFARQWRVAISTIKKAIHETHCRVISVIETWLREHGFIII